MTTLADKTAWICNIIFVSKIVPGGFSDNYTLQQLEFKLGKKSGFRNLLEKLERYYF